jgi:hypothetical protein
MSSLSLLDKASGAFAFGNLVGADAGAITSNNGVITNAELRLAKLGGCAVCWVEFDAPITDNTAVTAISITLTAAAKTGNFVGATNVTGTLVASLAAAAAAAISPISCVTTDGSLVVVFNYPANAAGSTAARHWSGSFCYVL